MIIGFDYESYYDKEYSLKRLSTHQYIRDPRWKCLGCGFQFGDEAPFYVEDPEPIFRKIDAYGWDKVVLVAHNAAFDGSVLYERYGKRRPGQWLDTSLIARWAIAQGHMPPEQGVSLAKLAPLVGMQKGDTWQAVHGDAAGRAVYGTEDVRIMMALLRLFMKWSPPPDELDYMDMHIRMMTEPVLHTDRDMLEEASIITPEMVELNKLLRKDANMVQLLEHHGIEVEYKTTPKGKRKPALAKTDAFMQDLVQHPQAKVAQLASLRLDANSSITRTRALTMLGVGNPLPFPALYYGAGTGRASGQDNYNMQNMPAGGVLRQAISAGDGFKLVVGDSGQIEARVVGWSAGEERLLEIFREADASRDPGRDAYRLFGGQYMYHIPPESLTDEQRKIAKAGLLGLGFGQGWRGLKEGARAKAGLIMSEEDAQAAVTAYREGFARVPQWWRRLKRWALEDGYIELPDGRRIIYPDMREEEWEFERDGVKGKEWVLCFDRPLIFSKGPRGKRQTVKFWHGLAAENCLSLDTLVLTQDGWVAMRDVGWRDVWDGEEWVGHDGLTRQQKKNTIHRNGVRLTPDHEVLTYDGWKSAAESEGPDRPEVRLADAGEIRGQRRASKSMDLPLPVWSDAHLSLNLASQWGREALRFCYMLARVPLERDARAGRDARHEQAPGILGLALDGGPMPASIPPGVAQLRGPGHYGMRTLGRVIRRLLGGHGRQLPTGIDARPRGQRARLLPVELPMGYAPPAGQEQAEQPGDRHPVGGNDGCRSERAQRHRTHYAGIPSGTRVAGSGSIQEAVADLKNCGPRQRFVVCAPGGVPFIVHNCVQATARSVVFWQAMQMRKEGIPVLGMSHDEVISRARADEAADVADRMQYWFRQVPPWAEGLPVNGKVVIGNNYMECK